MRNQQYVSGISTRRLFSIVQYRVPQPLVNNLFSHRYWIFRYLVEDYARSNRHQ